MDIDKYDKQRKILNIINFIVFLTYVIFIEAYLKKPDFNPMIRDFSRIAAKVYLIFMSVNFLRILKLNNKIAEKKFTSITMAIVALASILSLFIK